MSNKIQVGIIGAGANSMLHHIPKVQAIRGVRMAGVCNRSRESGDRVANEFAIPQVYNDWVEMVNDEAIDAIVIGTWPYMHCPATCAALEAGKHVMTEARMAMNAAEAHQMLKASLARPELVAQIVPSPMTLRFDRTIRRLLEEGYVGDLRVVDIDGSTGSFADSSAVMTWRQDVGLSGLNIMSMGIWYEAMARWVGHASRVLATTRVFENTRKDEDGNARRIEVPDHVDILAELVCGVQAHLRFSDTTAFSPASNTAHIYGTEGMLKLDLNSNELLGARRGDASMAVIKIPDEESQDWRVEEEFIGAIRGQEKIRLTTFEEGVWYMEFTEAVSRSSKLGQAVALPLS
jgi:predicted dehydrogenase